MNNTDDNTELTKYDRRYNELQVTVVRKAIKLLEDDLFKHVTDPKSQEYFTARITYLYLVASEGDSNLFTTRYLRSLHTLFNSYYQSFQSPARDIDFINADTERYFVYREINDVLEDFLCNY